MSRDRIFEESEEIIRNSLDYRWKQDRALAALDAMVAERDRLRGALQEIARDFPGGRREMREFAERVLGGEE